MSWFVIVLRIEKDRLKIEFQAAFRLGYQILPFKVQSFWIFLITQLHRKLVFKFMFSQFLQ